MSDILTEFKAWATSCGIGIPSNIRLAYSDDPNHKGISGFLDLPPDLPNEDGEPKAKKPVGGIYGIDTDEQLSTIRVEIEVPGNMLLNSTLQAKTPRVIAMREAIIAAQPDFFETYDGGKSIVAKSLISESNNLLVPVGSNMDDTEDDNKLPDTEKHVLRMHSCFIMSLWLLVLESKDPNSKWRPYIDLLPKTYDTPVYWSREDIELVKGTNLYEGVDQINDILKEVHRTIYQADSSVSQEDVNWAFTVFSSRSFGVCLDRENNVVHTNPNPVQEATPETAHLYFEPCLIPFADLFNHSNIPSVSYTSNPESRSFCLSIDTPKINGSEVCIHTSLPLVTHR